MSQQGLDFGRLWRLDDEYKLAFRATESAMDGVGQIVAAGACGMEAPDLSKTFVPNSGRHLRLRTIMGIGAIAGKDARRAIVQPIARLFGFDLVDEKPMSDAEYRARSEAALARHGDLGIALQNEIMGGRR